MAPISKMIFQIFLILIFVFCSASVKEMPPKLASCIMFYNEYKESRNLANLLVEAGRWKTALDKIQMVDFVGDSIAKDLRICQKIVQDTKSPKKLFKIILEDMKRHFAKHMDMVDLQKEIAANAKCEPKVPQMQMAIYQKLIANMTAKVESCQHSLKKMECPNGNGTKEIEQKGKEIAKWKEMEEIAQQLKEQLAEMRVNNDEQRKEFANKLEEEQQMSKKLDTQLLENAQKFEKLAIANGNWKFATFVLIGVSVLILAISTAIILLRQFKARMTPHI